VTDFDGLTDRRVDEGLSERDGLLHRRPLGQFRGDTSGEGVARSVDPVGLVVGLAEPKFFAGV